MQTYIHRPHQVAGGYIATVKILVAAPSLEDACDVVAAALSDPINTAFVDWSYIPRTLRCSGDTFQLRTATPSPTPNRRLTLTSQPPKRSATSKVRSCSHQTEATVDYPAEILKLLERNTAAGAYLSQVFTDWLDITHATLAALPAHAASAASKRSDAGTLAEDTPETQALFARCRARYPRPEYWQRFQQAFHLLLDSTEGFWDLSSAGRRWDTIGAVYMLTAYKKHSGQYFTPWNIAQLMAQMTIQDGAQEITDRLRQAQRIATERDDANSHLLAATILAGLAVPEGGNYRLFPVPHLAP